MRKGVFIFLCVLLAVLMLTSLSSAVNGEIIIAKKAALVVTSQPVIVSDAAISELEPEKYDSMIDTFHADRDAAIPEYGHNNDPAHGSATDSGESMQTVSETGEPPVHATVALMKQGDADKTREASPSTAPDSHGYAEVAVDPGNDDNAVQSNDPLRADVPDRLYADASNNNDTVSTSAAPGITDNDTIFTIQAGSYSQRSHAESKYKSLIQDMHAADLDHLRIEKVGEYYTVRLGRFDYYVTAMKFLNKLNSKLSSAVVIKAYIKNERIIQLHDDAVLAGK